MHLGTLEGVILEQAFLDSPVWELHTTDAVLDTLIPLSLVARAVFPVHLTVTVALVILVATLVIVAGLPCEHAHTIFLIVFVRAIVHVAVLVIESLLPFTFTVLQTVFEFSNVDTLVFPLVLAMTIWFTIDVGA